MDSITRIDAKMEKVVATIQAGLPGKGGDICYCDGSVWTTIFTIPLGRIDAESNHVTKQWTGPGGDSLRLRPRFNLADGLQPWPAPANPFQST